MSNPMTVNFDQYIKTGLQQYDSRNRAVAFFRELTQNSLDAIAKRRQIDPDADGLIQITIVKYGDGVAVAVQDTGIGMNQERLEALNRLGPPLNGSVASSSKILLYMAQREYEIVSCPFGSITGHQFRSPGLRYLNGQEFCHANKEIQGVSVGTTSKILVDDDVLFPHLSLSQDDIILRLSEAVRRFAAYSFANEITFCVNGDKLALDNSPVHRQLIWPLGADVEKYPGIKAYRLEYKRWTPVNSQEENNSLIVRSTGMYMFTGDFYTHEDKAYYLLEIFGHSTRYLTPSRDGLNEELNLVLRDLLSTIGKRFSSADDHTPMMSLWEATGSDRTKGSVIPSPLSPVETATQGPPLQHNDVTYDIRAALQATGFGDAKMVAQDAVSRALNTLSSRYPSPPLLNHTYKFLDGDFTTLCRLAWKFFNLGNVTYTIAALQRSLEVLGQPTASVNAINSSMLNFDFVSDRTEGTAHRPQLRDVIVSDTNQNIREAVDSKSDGGPTVARDAVQRALDRLSSQYPSVSSRPDTYTTLEGSFETLCILARDAVNRGDFAYAMAALRRALDVLDPLTASIDFAYFDTPYSPTASDDEE